MSEIIYPLGHSDVELARLDLQASLLHDAMLDNIVSGASTVLEIGCGNGANLALLRKENPNFKYTGIDISQTAIKNASERFQSDENACFHYMDGAALDFPAASFDVIFTKLVLWSIGPAWTLVLKEAHRLLAQNGVFYAMEPANDMIEIYPEKPALTMWMNTWDKAVGDAGMDTYIGSKVAKEIRKTGFREVDSKFYPVIACAGEKDRYSAIINNLKGFYMGQAAEYLGVEKRATLAQALQELETITPDSLVMDALFVSIGRK